MHTAARARVTGSAESGVYQASASGRASARGWHTLRFRLRGARPGQRIVITVHVSRHARTGTCQASVRPRPAPRPARVSVPAPTPQPSTLGPAPSPPARAGCYPRSNAGNCYEPGEFCRDSDHGMTGVAGNGEKIICEDKDGWRWEPA
ncbi:MAG TPA: hypothetical protein VFV41_22905 [Streptosporangiaceae bacterium]|nr:hypothetical protein [Streptosporangiaceae bacterium]